MEVDMSDSDDSGGSEIEVTTEQTTTSHPSRSSRSHPAQPTIARDYHQPIPLSFESGKDLWQFPMPVPQKRPQGKTSAAVYRRAINTTRSHWNCEPADFLPPQLRKLTPYSLAMLARFRKLSFNTKGHREEVHTRLLDARNGRLERMGLKSQGDEVNLVDATPCKFRPHPNGKQTEKVIKENVYGLTLEDIRDVLAEIYDGLMAAKLAKATKAATNNTNPDLDRKTRAGEVVEKRRQEKKDSKKAIREEKKKTRTGRRRKRQSEQAKASPDPPQNPKDVVDATTENGESKRGQKAVTRAQKKHEKRQLDQAEISANHPANLMDVVDAMAEKDPNQAQGKKQRSQDSELARKMMGAFGDEKGETRKENNRHRKLLARLEERNAARASAMRPLPSEQMQFGSMPSLFMQARQAKIQSGMDSMGLNVQQPLPGIVDQGGVPLNQSVQ